MSNDRNKVVIIGLDGASWSFINILIEKSIVPNLKALLNKHNVVKKILRSILPPYTPPAWTSIASGVNPGKHGIYDFHIVVKGTSGFITRIASAYDVKYPRLHNMLSMHGFRSIIYNLPLTYPPWFLKDRYSIIVNDWMAPEIRIHPQILESKYINYFNKGLKALDLKGSKQESFEYMIERLEWSTAGILEFMEKYNWNLVFTVFSEVDWSLHGNIHVIRGNFIGKSKEVFKKIDWFIGKVMEYTNNIIIVSDHGFTLCDHIINIPFILYRHGLIMEKLFTETLSLKILNKKIDIPPHVMRFIRSHKKIKSLARKFLFKLGGKAGRERRREVAYRDTKAIVPDAGIIYTAPSYKEKIKEIIMQDPNIIRIYEPKELYKGPYLSNAPDLILEPKLDYCLGISTRCYKVEGVTSHHRDGVFIGHFIDEDLIAILDNIDVLKLWDVTPIVLYLLGLPLPSDTDSQLLNLLGAKTMNYSGRYKLIRRLHNIREHSII